MELKNSIAIPAKYFLRMHRREEPFHWNVSFKFKEIIHIMSISFEV